MRYVNYQGINSEKLIPRSSGRSSMSAEAWYRASPATQFYPSRHNMSLEASMTIDIIGEAHEEFFQGCFEGKP
jgi:hypothetical protein